MGNSRRKGVLIWWALSFPILALCAFLRGKANDLGVPVHSAEVETALFGSLPTVWLQREILPLWPAGLEWASVFTHSSWLGIPFLAAVFVSWKRPQRIGSFFRWWIALHLIVVPVFALFPLEPPWLASGEVIRLNALHLGGEVNDPNPLAAMPSLHVALPTLLGFWFFAERWRAPGVAMLAYASILSVEVVFSGEHYIMDVFGAVAIAGAIAAVARLDYRRMLSWLSALSRTVIAGRSNRSEPALELAAVRQRERGQALIELALVLPLIFVFIMVIVDFGIALDRREVIQHGVREGARMGAVGASEADIIAHTVNESAGTFAPADVAVCYVDGDDANGNAGNAGDFVRVSGTFNYAFTVGGGEMLTAWGVTPPSITMTPSAEARLEAPVLGASAC